MALLTKEEQHEGRNAIQNLKGLLRRFKKEGKINDQEHILTLCQLKRVDNIFNGVNHALPDKNRGTS